MLTLKGLIKTYVLFQTFEQEVVFCLLNPQVAESTAGCVIGIRQLVAVNSFNHSSRCVAGVISHLLCTNPGIRHQSNIGMAQFIRAPIAKTNIARNLFQLSSQI
jgi:hypothetical protein